MNPSTTVSRVTKSTWLDAVSKAATLSKNYKHRKTSQRYLERVVKTCPYHPNDGAEIINKVFNETIALSWLTPSGESNLLLYRSPFFSIE